MTAITQTNTAIGQPSEGSRWVGFAQGLVDAAFQAYRRHRTRRELMAMSSWQRRDAGLEGFDVRSACELEAAARRRLDLGVPADWS